MAEICIFSIEDDFHAALVAQRLNDRGHKSHVIFTDRLTSRHKFSGLIGDSLERSILLTGIANESFRLEDMQSIWWRRNGIFREGYTDEESRIALSDWYVTIINSNNIVSSRWISHPRQTQIFSDKIAQYTATRDLGISFPKTYISNDFEFLSNLLNDEKKYIIKTINIPKNKLIFTSDISIDELNKDQLSISPVLVQEKITGSEHLRVNVFGDEVISFRLLSDTLDWKSDKWKFEYFETPDNLRHDCLNFLRHCGLSMGIFDFKIDSNGNIIFLECNPQGQFLFLEGATGVPMLDAFVDFITNS